MNSFNELVTFSARYINPLKQIKRAIYLDDTNTLEDDAQHTFDVTAICLYLYNMFPEQLSDLDLAKILSLATVHDIIETYIGDTDATYMNEDKKATIEANTIQALKRMSVDCIRYKFLQELVIEFEEQSSKEAIFVKAVDRLAPALLEYHNVWFSSKYKNTDPIELERLITKLELHPVTAIFIPNLISDMKECLNASDAGRN